MTREEKAKAYDKALEKAKSMIDDLRKGEDILAVSDLESMFPELKESEDERIRKAILGLTYLDGIEPILTKCSITAQDIRKYLEKQKEASKAIEAVEKINKYIDEHLANENDMMDSNPDKKYYCGWDDALGKMAGILEDVYSEEKKKESLRDFIDDFPYSAEKEERDYHKVYEDIAKSDRSKMASVGKSLGEEFEQKEQNPAKKENTLTGFEKVLDIFLFDFANSPIEYCGPEEYIKKHSAEILKAAYKELNAKLQQDVFEAKQEGRRKGYEVAKAEQTPAEIDDYKIIKKHISEDMLSSEVNKRLTECGWYVTDEKPAEWSEEDKFKLEDAITGIDVGIGFYETEGKHPNLLKAIIEAKEWLKSLRPQPHTVSIKDTTKFGNLEYERGVKDGIQHAKNYQWKPSEEQLGYLSKAIATFAEEGDSKTVDILNELRKDLNDNFVKI